MLACMKNNAETPIRTENPEAGRLHSLHQTVLTLTFPVETGQTSKDAIEHGMGAAVVRWCLYSVSICRLCSHSALHRCLTTD